MASGSIVETIFLGAGTVKGFQKASCMKHEHLHETTFDTEETPAGDFVERRQGNGQ